MKVDDKISTLNKKIDELREGISFLEEGKKKMLREIEFIQEHIDDIKNLNKEKVISSYLKLVESKDGGMVEAFARLMAK